MEILKTKRPLKAWLILAPPDEIIAEVRKRIRAALGDDVENNTRVIARNGYFFIKFPRSVYGAILSWTRSTVVGKRRTAFRQRALRRYNLESFFKDLRNKELTRVRRK